VNTAACAMAGEKTSAVAAATVAAAAAAEAAVVNPKWSTHVTAPLPPLPA
jgi:hypothetical protein